jgi:hypothetical protein
MLLGAGLSLLTCGFCCCMAHPGSCRCLVVLVAVVGAALQHCVPWSLHRLFSEGIVRVISWRRDSSSSSSRAAFHS